jgi:hypothetical protein
MKLDSSLPFNVFSSTKDKVTVTKASNKHEIVRSSSCIFKLNEEIALLLEHFHEILERSGCNHDAIMNQNGEWKDFKAFVFRHRTTVKFENFFIFPDLRCRFRNRIFLLELLLSFP